MRRACKAVTASFAAVGCGTGSLRLGLSSTGVPGRSQAHTWVNLLTPGKTAGLDLSEKFQSSAEALRPPTNTTVGDPLPLPLRYILRPPPMSTNPAKSPVPAPWTPDTPSEVISKTWTVIKTSSDNRRFIDSLGVLQLLGHYMTGPLVPNTRGK